MNRKSLVFVATIAALLSLSCATSSRTIDIGSFDRNRVELLPDGTAKYVDILSFNDFHATVSEDPLGKNPGMAKMATVVKNLREINPNTVIVSCGDNYQGSALSIVTKGKIVSDFFGIIGVAASAVGNHEFDWGDGYFATWSESANFPFLAANIIDKRTGKIPSWARPYSVVRVGGHTIAFIGLSTQETPASVKADNVANYKFTDAGEAARYWATYLRATVKPEAIIAISHLPSATDELDANHAVAAQAKLDEIAGVCLKANIDALMTGHSHMTVKAQEYGIPVLQAGYNGRSFGKIHITFGGSKVKFATEMVNFYTNKSELAEDPSVKAIIASYNAQYGAQFLRRVAVLDGELAHDRLLTPNVSPMGAWVCDVLRDRFKVDVAIMNGGGLRKGFLAGPVAVQDFWDLMPFDNTAVVFEATGADLKKMIDHGIDSLDFANGQFSGLQVSYNPSRPYGSKITSMRLADGTPVLDNKIYKIVTNDFVFEGGDQYTMMLPAARNVVYTYIPIRDVLIAAAEKTGRITAPIVNTLIADSN